MQVYFTEQDDKHFGKLCEMLMEILHFFSSSIQYKTQFVWNLYKNHSSVLINVQRLQTIHNIRYRFHYESDFRLINFYKVSIYLMIRKEILGVYTIYENYFQGQMRFRPLSAPKYIS
jgi:hypothetical protein